MVVAVALWSLVLQPGKAESVIPPGDLKITNIALGEELADENSRTSVRLIYSAPRAHEDSEDEEEEEDDVEEEPTPTILCSLTPGRIEQANIELILEAEQEVVFETVGKNVVYLTGNYIDQTPDSDQPPYDSDDEGLPLEDYDSDVELDADELDELSEEDDSHRFEEIQEEEEEEEPAPKHEKPSKKRARESDITEADEPPKQLSKAEKKKLKKQKAEDGKAITTAEEKSEVKEEKPKDKKEGKKEKQKREEKELSGGIKSWDHKVGTGPQAKAGDKVSVRYVGKLTSGKVFDSNTKGKPFMFRLGAGEVIKGWDIGLVGMQVGGERMLTIPAPMAYGKKAQQGIPANSTLIFEIKLVKIN